MGFDERYYRPKVEDAKKLCDQLFGAICKYQFIFAAPNKFHSEMLPAIKEKMKDWEGVEATPELLRQLASGKMEEHFPDTIKEFLRIVEELSVRKHCYSKNEEIDEFVSDVITKSREKKMMGALSVGMRTKKCHETFDTFQMSFFL